RLSADRGRNVIGGSIFMNNLDLTHPLGYGYQDSKLPVFRKGTVFMEMPKNPYAAPLVYTQDPLVSGYSSKENVEKASKSAAIVVSGMGRGRVIAMADNPNFRAFWYGTNKLMANSIFFGQTISGNATEKK
ncbi:MAG: zinc carboxypeptidase, partial [Saprospiraceae bacterium]